MSAYRVGYRTFHRDPNIDYQLNRLAADASDAMLAEIPSAAREIRGLPDWVAQMFVLAAKAERAGRLGDATRYVRAAEFFLPPNDPRKAATYVRFHALLDRAQPDHPPRVMVAYGGAALPAYEFPCAAAEVATVVVHGGFDSFIEEFFPLLAELAARGYRVIAFDGPGQGGALHAAQPMTPEWEHPVRAVLDHFGVRACVLVGISLGGYLALRAAAFEPRIRAVVAFDVMFDFFDCVMSRRGRAVVPLMRWLLDHGRDAAVDQMLSVAMRVDDLASWGITQGMHVTGTSSPASFARAIEAYSARSISHLVMQDVLLLAGEADHFVPLWQLEEQRAALSQAHSVRTRVFTAREHGANHCQIGNLPLALGEIDAWIRSLS